MADRAANFTLAEANSKYPWQQQIWGITFL